MTQRYTLLNQGEDNEMELFGYKKVKWRQALCIVGYFFSFGFLRLLFYWKPEFDIWCHSVPCSLEEATVIMLRATDELKQYYKKEVITIHPKVPGTKPNNQFITDENYIISKSIMKPDLKVRYIMVQKIRYVWNTSESIFQKVGILDEELSCSDIHSRFGFGLTKEEQEFRRQVCGLNKIEVEIIPIWKLLFKQIFNPFYAFQAYSLCIWIATGYSEFGIAIVIMTVMSVTATVYNLRLQSIKLHNMADSYNSIMVTVLQKNGGLKDVESQSLVPGDVIVLAANKLFVPCDAILISGGCTVNESMLTGESVPVTKIALSHNDNAIPWKTFSGEDYKKHVLYCGTEVIQTKAHGKDPVKAVVLQTGFNTTKGNLVRSILYDKPLNVKLHKDAMRFLLGLVVLAVLSAIYTAIVYTINGASVQDTVLMSLLVLTTAVNAALPAALTLGLLYAQVRLKKQGIFCISPQRINVSGLLNLICFDKTGTLTENILDLWGAVPSYGSCFQDVHYFASGNTLPWGPLLGAMTSCHSLIILDGKIHGDPLDLKMFQGTGWELADDKTCTSEDGKSISCTVVKPGARAGKVPVEGIAILHQFPFSSSLQRMSVITQEIGGEELTVFMKGAPEMVISFCKPKTVPQGFTKNLEIYSTQGFRVIGLAYKLLNKTGLPSMEQLDRKEIESDLTFLGLLVVENCLKPETNPVLQELKAANIKTVMVTGDNLQTAVTIGKNSGMISNGSELILIEATEPEGDAPASITWTTMADNQENKHTANEPYHENDGVYNYNPVVQGKYRFVICGNSFQVIMQHFYNLVPKILLNGTIFARMSPQQKTTLVEEFQKLDYHVGMCGDGANDCGALKMAHAGISLTELEASVASPFTSKIQNIECVPKLIKEGRNSLVTSFSMFKLMTLNVVTGLSSELLLFWKQTLLGNYQFILLDMGIVIASSLTLSLNGPSPKLVPYRPSGNLLSPPLLLSVFLHSVFAIVVQTTAFALALQQPWYNETDVFSACLPLNHTTGNQTMREPAFSINHLTTTMGFVLGMNFIIIEFVFAKGRPFRQPLYTNYVLTFLLVLQVTTYLVLYFADNESLYVAMELVCTPYYWRIYIFILMLVRLIISYAAEEGFIENRNLWLWIKRKSNYQSKSQYRKLQKIIEEDPDWPPRTEQTMRVSQSLLWIARSMFIPTQRTDNEEERIKKILVNRQDYDCINVFHLYITLIILLIHSNDVWS